MWKCFFPLEETFSSPFFSRALRPTGKFSSFGNLYPHTGNGICAICKFSPLARSECNDAIFAFLYDQPTVSPFLTGSAGISMNPCAPGVFRTARDANGASETIGRTENKVDSRAVDEYRAHSLAEVSERERNF